MTAALEFIQNLMILLSNMILKKIIKSILSFSEGNILSNILKYCLHFEFQIFSVVSEFCTQL